MGLDGGLQELFFYKKRTQKTFNNQMLVKFDECWVKSMNKFFFFGFFCNFYIVLVFIILIIIKKRHPYKIACSYPSSTPCGHGSNSSLNAKLASTLQQMWKYSLKRKNVKL